MSSTQHEIVAVRSLTESDLGLFAAHRTGAKSNQRAININADAARIMVSPAIFAAGGDDLTCICMFDGETQEEKRRLGKVHKNWRLGGPKIEGKSFARLDSKDFVLIRSIRNNDGSSPLILSFVSRNIDRVLHAGIAAIVDGTLQNSMAVFSSDTPAYRALILHCPRPHCGSGYRRESAPNQSIPPVPHIPPMPRDSVSANDKPRNRTIGAKIREPHIMERMLKAAGDLSAPAQLRFMQTVEALASQLREVLLETGGIIKLTKDHTAFWAKAKGHRVGFVDGGLANLTALGSTPIAARVGGFTVVPGQSGEDREHFLTLKQLIDELYRGSDGGIYNDSFPDLGALRDAARIAIEAGGAVRLLSEFPDHRWVLIHGALVNPVSRYSDVMERGKVRFGFPDFSNSALDILLPESDSPRVGRDCNFISVHRRQLQLLSATSTIVCGVVERESTTSSVCRAVLDSLDDELIKDFLEDTPARWKQEFRNAVDPSGGGEFDGQRISDPLLFRCVLEPEEVLVPVPLDRNELRRAPERWKDIIAGYPKPRVSYLQVSEWSAPIRIEMFEKDLGYFKDTAELIFHCAALLPRYAFPVGLDIVDKYARIPNWMSRPVNTRTAVVALKQALDRGEVGLFDALRRILCGSSREFFLRPTVRQ